MEVIHLWMQEHRSLPAETQQEPQQEWEGASPPTLQLWTPTLQSPWLQPSIFGCHSYRKQRGGSKQPAWSGWSNTTSYILGASPERNKVVLLIPTPHLN